MAADFTQDAVLHFLQDRGGSVRNADLLLHFRFFLRDHADRDRNRELFKKFVNSVASVRQEDGVSYVVLKRKFRGHVPGIGDGSGRESLGMSSGNVHPFPAWNADKPWYKGTEIVPTQPGHTATKSILPAAGIILNNNSSSSVETNLNLTHKLELSSASGPTSSVQGVFTACSEQPPHGQAPTEALVRNERESNSTQKQAPSPEPVHVALKEPASRLQEHREPTLFLQLSESAPIPAQVFTALPPQQPRSLLQTSATPPQVYLGVCEAPIGSQIEKRGTQQQTSAKHTQLDLSEAPFQENATKISPEKPADSKSAHFEPNIRFETHTEQKHYPQSIAPRRVRHRKSYRSAVSFNDDEEEDIEEVITVRRGSAPLEAAGVWDLKATMGNANRIMSQSSPSLEKTVPQIQVQDLEPSCGRSFEEALSQPQKLSLGRIIPQIQIQDLESDSWRGSEAGHVTPVVLHKAHGHRTSPALDQSQISGLSLGFHSVSSPSSGFSSSDRASAWSSCEDLQSTAPVHFSSTPAMQGDSGCGAGVEDVLQRAQRAAPQLGPNRSNSKTSWNQSAEELNLQQEPAPVLRVWHHSTGDLYDDGADSSDGFTSLLAVHQRPVVARRLSSKLRSRMCVSVGSELDQLLQDKDKRALGGSEAARLNRLHLISSTLSLCNLSSSSLSSCSTPPRCHSLADLIEKDTKRGRSLPSTAQPQDGSSRQSQVPLEALEHLWLVKAASGAWPDIYSLFREDSSLLHRRDFISGFTVLHWVAKHGDHRVLNTLWYGVEKAGLTFDIDAQSLCGYTPLHIAAIHNHRNIIRLLVNKFSANIRVRDAAGKRAWFYLLHSSPPDIFQLLGAPPKAALVQMGASQRWGSPPQQQHSQKRQRRHHFSSASGERPLALAGNTKVKRSMSLAAFLKHKSLQKAKAQSEWVV